MQAHVCRNVSTFPPHHVARPRAIKQSRRPQFRHIKIELISNWQFGTTADKQRVKEVVTVSEEMAHFQHHGHEQQATRVDEYGNPIPGGHGILGQTGEYATGTGTHHGMGQTAGYGTGTGSGTGIGGHEATGGYGRQAGYGPIGTGMHADGGHGGSGQPGFGVTGTGIHDAGGIGSYGPTGTGPHATGHGLSGTGTGHHTGMPGVTHGTGHTGILGGKGTRTHDTGHTGMLGGMGTGTHGAGHTGMHGATTGLGTHGTGHGVGTGIAGTHGAEHKTGGILRRSGSSSSSSSSEDDGMGGRRKKGMKEKIKEKLPGGHKDNQYQQSAGTGAYGQDSAYTGTTGTGMGTGGHGYAEGTHEKKGMMDKIKEKLPGGHKDEYGQQQHNTTTATGGYGPGRTGTTDTYGATEGTHEKKGIMEKIKEKLPGNH